MTLRWLFNDYLMTIRWLSNDYHELLITFLMFIDLKRSIDRRWLFKSGATFLLRWSSLLLNLNGWICQTFVSRHHPLTPCGGLPHLARHKKVTKMIEGRRSIVPLAIVNTLVLKQKRIPTKKVLNCIWPGAIMCELEETAGAWIVQCSWSAYYRVGGSVHAVRIIGNGEVSSIFPSGRTGVFDLAIIISRDQFQRNSKIRDITLMVMVKAASLRTTSLVEE